MAKRLIGSHLPFAGLAARQASLGVTTAQVFLGSPKTWRVRPPLTKKELETLPSMPVFVHAPYLFNPCSPNPEVRGKTRDALQGALSLLASLEGTPAAGGGLIVHGGQGGKDASLQEAVDRWRGTVESLDLVAPLLIENTAGGACAPGRSLEGFSMLMKALEEFPSVGYCLDTCHAWAGSMGLENLHERLLDAVGKPPALIHLNGSDDPKDSGRDHHANLHPGEEMTELALRYAEEAEGVPLVLETPGYRPSARGGRHAAHDLALLKERFWGQEEG